MPAVKPSFFKRFAFEYWPTWLLYFPVYVIFPYWYIRFRSFSLITLANPGFYLGGIKNENKYNILKHIPDRFKPKTLAFSNHATYESVIELMLAQQLTFPIIIKPQIGERGNGVEKLSNEADLIEYLKLNVEDFMLQEFIDWPEEFGVLWFQIPDGEFGISSLVQKSFLTLTGDGIQTVQALLLQAERAQDRLPYLLEKHQVQLHNIPALGEKFLLEPIGNHCRGTQFINANSLINNKLVGTIEEIASHVPGFFIGRFDVKAASLEDLMEGKNIKVMELNGITSEPGHIYHPGRGALKGWRDLFHHWHLVFKIAAANRAKGLKTPGTFYVLRNLNSKETFQ